MNLLKYSNTIEKKIHGNSDLYLNSLMKKIQLKLRNIEARSEITNDTILFKRIVRSTTHSGENKREAMKILRDGQIRIRKINSNKIEIFWEVELDTLLFLSMVIGLVIGLIAGFASSMIIISMIIGSLFSIIAYFIGCSIIKSKIDEIVETSI